MLAVNVASLVGIGLVSVALITVFFSPYRHWLGFMLAGMLVWGLIEVIRLGAQIIFELPMMYGYVAAFTVTMLVITMLLIIEDRRAERMLAKRRYVEHTPVYEDEQQHCSSR